MSEQVRGVSILFVVVLVLAFAGAGGNVGQYLFWSGRAREADERYARAQQSAGATIDNLNRSLERSVEELADSEGRIRSAIAINKDITDGLQSNVRSVQDAIALIRKVRAYVQTLADVLHNRSSGNGGGGSPDNDAH